MLSDAQEGDVISGKPWIWMPPAIMITILSINFVGKGLRMLLIQEVDVKYLELGTLSS